MARVAETHESREDAAIARERRRYVEGEQDLDTFEDRVEAILRDGEQGQREDARAVPVFEGQEVLR